MGVDREELLGVGDVARLLGQPRHRVAYLLDCGRLKPVAVVGGRRLLGRDQLAEIGALLQATVRRSAKGAER